MLLRYSIHCSITVSSQLSSQPDMHSQPWCVYKLPVTCCLLPVTCSLLPGYLSQIGLAIGSHRVLPASSLLKIMEETTQLIPFFVLDMSSAHIFSSKEHSHTLGFENILQHFFVDIFGKVSPIQLNRKMFCIQLNKRGYHWLLQTAD